MKTVDHLLSEELISALGWTLIHALWQGALLAVLLAIVLVLTHRYSSKARYFIAVISFGLFAVSTIVSFSLLYNPSQIEATESIAQMEASDAALPLPTSNPMTAERSGTNGIDEQASRQVNLLIQTKKYFKQHLPLIVTLWMLGVVVLLLRFLGGLAYIQRLKSYRTELLPDAWLEQGDKLKKQLQLKKKVVFLASYKVLTPLAIGIFRPAILFPAQLLSGLSQQQVEAILLHELAHIKRNDYLVNVLQTLIDILFFYHPAIWWMSATIRNERENCCDDMVIAITGETGNYARTLILLKEQEINPKLPAMAFTGIKYKFNHRIKRLFNQPTVFADFREGFVTALILVVGLFAIAVNAFGTPSFLQFAEPEQVTQMNTESSSAEPETLATLPDGTSAEFLPIKTQESQEEGSQPEEGDQTVEITQQFPAEKNSELDLLLEAIDDGNKELVQFMIDKGAKVNAATKDGWTPLMEAADEGHLEIVELLLSKGANVNATTNQGYTPLMVAVDEGHSSIAQLLIQKGANLDATTKKGWDAFMEAIDGGQMEIVQLLIDKGADVNRVYGHHTPLMEAIDEGNLEIAKLLLQKGADPNKASDDGYTPLMEAADAGQHEIVKLLIDRGAHVQAQNKEGWNALMEAIDEGQLELVKLFLSKGFDVNTAYGHHTPLMEAIDEGHVDIVKLLIDKGARVNQANKEGYTPLMEAINEGHKEITELLLARGADINAQTRDGHTALMEAADEGHVQIFNYLIDKGADIHATRENGYTVLMEAADEGQLEIARILIQKGVDVNAKADVEWTHFDSNKLISRIESGWTALFEAVHEEQEKIVQLLLDNGARVNETITQVVYDVKADKREKHEGWSPLMEAVESNHLPIVKLLVQRKADVNAQTSSGLSVLDIAKKHGSQEMINFIKSRSAQ